MAVQNMRALEFIQKSDSLRNVVLLENNNEIVQYAFNSHTSLYHTAKHLYYSLYYPLNPGLDYLFRIARRCDIAKDLAVALADQLQKTHTSNSSNFQLPGIRFDPASYDRFITNVQPYIIALAHFFECFRDELARYNPSPYYLKRNVELSILTSKYNRETAHRICALYYTLKKILDQKLDDASHTMCRIALDKPLQIMGTTYSDCIDVFIFGGLEAVKDIMVQPTVADGLSIAEDHFARAFPDSITRVHTLPPSTLPEISRAEAVRICRLLSPRRFQVLDIGDLSGVEYRPRGHSKEQVVNSFYEYLVNYEGDVPRLGP